MVAPNFREIELPNACDNCKHSKAQRHCSCCPTEYECIKHKQYLSDLTWFICDDWEKDE